MSHAVKDPMHRAAALLASAAVCGGVVLVLLIYTPQLQAPFLVPKFAALNVCASLGVIAFGLRKMALPHAPWNRLIAIGCIAVMATTGLSWIAALSRPDGAPYAATAIARWGAVFGIALAARILDENPVYRQRVFETIALALGAVAVVGLLQHIGRLPLQIPVISIPGSTFGNRNAAGELMAMGLPFALIAAAGAQGFGRHVVLGSVLVDLAYLGVTRTRGAWVALACGLLFIVVVFRALLRRHAKLAGGIALAFLLSAVVVAALPAPANSRDVGDAKRYAAITSVIHDSFDARSTAVTTRLGLWRRTLTMIQERPMFGVGPGNWPVQFPRFAEPGATRDGVLSATLAPRQAHQDILERTAETGLTGLLALLVLAAGAALNVRSQLQMAVVQDRFSITAAAASLIALGVLGLTGFPLEAPGTLLLAGIGLGLLARETSQPTDATGRQSVIAWTILLAGLALTATSLFHAQRAIRASRQLAIAEAAIRDPKQTLEGISAVDRAIEAMPNDQRATLRSAQLLLQAGRANESATRARAALALEPYSPNAWASLAASNLAAHDAARARRDASTALALLHDYPFALRVRADAADAEGDAKASEVDLMRLRDLASGPDSDATARTARSLLRPLQSRE